MANFATLAIPDQLVPRRTAGTTTVAHKVDPSQLASLPAASDTIQLFTIPAGSRIIDAFLRTTAVAASAGFLTLQLVQAGTTTSLSSTIASNSSSTSNMLTTYAPPLVDTVNPITIQVLVSTQPITTSGTIEAIIGFEPSL
jgi:hypothetical protein